ncbi:hypothetical protein EVAR_60493_1 [Eumeta japonica]|uniref:Uncharacterized protein n=1 Tax=Eumeta variegata TaxID=151549 RepID=A0A4C1ZMN5_EUMVA|nr:hypothetical protein EVAR_60493_1 [Eumeta japonica]
MLLTQHALCRHASRYEQLRPAWTGTRRSGGFRESAVSAGRPSNGAHHGGYMTDNWSRPMRTNGVLLRHCSVILSMGFTRRRRVRQRPINVHMPPQASQPNGGSTNATTFEPDGSDTRVVPNLLFTPVHVSLLGGSINAVTHSK